MAGDTKSIVAAVAEVNDLKDAIGDLKKEIGEALDSLNNFGRVGSLSVRNLGSEARGLQSTFRDISREFRRMSTPSSAIGAAATSQALGTLTGGGGGGGGGGPRMSFGSGARTGLGEIAGKAIQGPFAGLGKILGGKLGGALSALGSLMGKGAAVALPMAVSGGVGFLEGSMSRRMGLEQAGRSYLGFERMLPKSRKLGQFGPGIDAKFGARAGKYGFNAEDLIQTTLPMLPMADRGKEGRKRLETFVGQQMLPFSTGVGLGTGVGALQSFSGAARAAGADFGGITDVFERTRTAGGQGNARESLGVLGSIRQALGTLINIQGTSNAKDTQRFMRGAGAAYFGIKSQTGYTPEAAAPLVNQLFQAGLSPGGGEAGQVAMLQTMGFGMPDLAGQSALAGRMGMGSGRFGKRRNYLEAKLAMQSQTAEETIDSLLLTSRRIGGEDQKSQAQVLSQLVPGLSFKKAHDLVGGDTTLSEEVAKAFKEGKEIEGAPTGGYRDQVQLIEEYNRMVNLSLSIEKKRLKLIAKAMTDLKVLLLGPLTEALTGIPKVLEKSATALETIKKTVGDLFGDAGTKSTQMKGDFEQMAKYAAVMKGHMASAAGMPRVTPPEVKTPRRGAETT